MSNNPFRQKQVSGHNSAANRNDVKKSWKGKKMSSNHPTRKEREWGKVKFNPKLQSASEEAPTPWAKLRNGIVQNGLEKQDLDVESEGAKQFRKERQNNYRKMLIMEKQQEPTEWESFNDDNEIENKDNKVLSKGKLPSHKQKQEGSLNQGNTVKPFLSKSELKNFDKIKLNFTQNNLLRKVITRTTIMSKNDTLEMVVKDIKRRGIRFNKSGNN